METKIRTIMESLAAGKLTVPEARAAIHDLRGQKAIEKKVPSTGAVKPPSANEIHETEIAVIGMAVCTRFSAHDNWQVNSAC